MHSYIGLYFSQENFFLDANYAATNNVQHKYVLRVNKVAWVKW